LPKPLRLTINRESSSSYALTWPSRYGMVYDLRSSIDLKGDPLTWPIHTSNTGIAANVTGTNMVSVFTYGERVRFYVIVERNPTP